MQKDNTIDSDNTINTMRDHTMSHFDVSENKYANIILTTSFFVAHYDIKNEIDIITAECVYGMHIGKDMFAVFRDFFGGRSKVVQDTLRDARRTVLFDLRKEAAKIEADAVIAVDLDYQELSGGGKKGMIMIVASGTAVKLGN